MQTGGHPSRHSLGNAVIQSVFLYTPCLSSAVCQQRRHRLVGEKGSESTLISRALLAHLVIIILPKLALTAQMT
ncbi:unnamed protein product [Rodentolepis nana]|uniref:Secreted protein n=1 Tax=Rodentolepis nana TaxID=102285 RepID=A0A0R3TPR1_RODNA|nr:unnamed protein product [Rodentolepis nana]